MLARYPEIIGAEAFAATDGVDSTKALSPQFIRRLVFSQSAYCISLDDALKKFPHLDESADFHQMVRNGSKSFSLLSLLRCERSRFAEPASSLTAQTEQILADAVDSNAFMKEMRRHRVFGPFIDHLLDGAAKDLASSPLDSSDEWVTESIKRGLLRRSRDQVEDHGTPKELLERFDSSLMRIDEGETSTPTSSKD